MVFNFLRPEQVLKAERTARAGKIEKRSKAEEIFQPPAKRPKGAKQQQNAERLSRRRCDISVIF